MKAYSDAMAELEATHLSNIAEYLSEAVIEADGSIKCAADAIGAHPNTVSKFLNRAGIDFRELRRLAAERKKPVHSADVDGAERRTA